MTYSKESCGRSQALTTLSLNERARKSIAQAQATNHDIERSSGFREAWRPPTPKWGRKCCSTIALSRVAGLVFWALVAGCSGELGEEPGAESQDAGGGSRAETGAASAGSGGASRGTLGLGGNPSVGEAKPFYEAFDLEQIDAALADAQDLRYATDPHSVGNEYGKHGAIGAARRFYLLSLALNLDALDAERRLQAIERVQAHLESVTTGGQEPSARGSIAGWADNPFALGVALNKATDDVWSSLPEATQLRLDKLMQAMAIAGNYNQNFDNFGGIDLCEQFGGYEKHYNPNIQEGYVGVMVAAHLYFGGAQAVNAILVSFDYEEFTAELEALGFTNITGCWEQAGAELMESGGTDSDGGTLVGVRVPFTYQLQTHKVPHESWPEQLQPAVRAIIEQGLEEDGRTRIAYDPLLIWEGLAFKFYSQQATTGDPQKDYCRFLEPTAESQEAFDEAAALEGSWGMGFEFVAADAQGVRCSPRYVYDGWANNIPTLATIIALGHLRSGDGLEARLDSAMSRLLVGSEHLIAAYAVGYRGRSKGKVSTFGPGGPEGLGYSAIVSIYRSVVAPNARRLID